MKFSVNYNAKLLTLLQDFNSRIVNWHIFWKMEISFDSIEFLRNGLCLHNQIFFPICITRYPFTKIFKWTAGGIYNNYEGMHNPLLICTLILKNQVEKINWFFSLQKSISKLIFAGYTGSKNPV